MSELGMQSKVEGFGEEFMKNSILGQKVWRRWVPSPQWVQCQRAAQKPPMGFDRLTFLGAP